MKIVSLAAGVVVGYVLGTRAGRERFEQIAATARRVSAGRPQATPPANTAGVVSAPLG